jgi:diacylglycerol kinase (ATP)
VYREFFPLPPEADRVLLSVSPMAGAGSSGPKVEELSGLLRKKGFQVEVLTDLDDLSRQAQRWHEAGSLRAVVGVGGDGTAAELVNRTQPGVPLTMFPLGTANLLAKYLGLGFTPEAVCRTIEAGAVTRLDAAMAGDRIFLLMVGCGFDAEVVHRLHGRRRGHISPWTYAKPILDAIRSYEYPNLRVYCDEAADAGEPTFTARWLFAFNLPCYGGGLTFTPEAIGTDGRLDLCAFRRGSLWHGLGYLAAVLLGRHAALADCRTARVTRLRVEADRRVPYQLDGDPGGFLPVEIQVLPERLTVVVPPPEVES